MSPKVFVKIKNKGTNINGLNMAQEYSLMAISFFSSVKISL